jgi:hypothetical protein
MGMDFVALMKYAGPNPRLLRTLDDLETGSPAELRDVTRLMADRGFTVNPDRCPAAWESLKEPPEGPSLHRRPDLPTLDVALHTPEDFFLTFGPDAVEVYHLLRWLFFLTDPPLQAAMLDACRCLGRLFGATYCVITSDWSPFIGAFRQSKSFDESLAAAGSEHGEQARLADLYLESPEDYVLRGAVGGRTEYKDWPVDKPTPAGWERACTWDSKGYWRLRLSEA